MKPQKILSGFVLWSALLVYFTFLSIDQLEAGPDRPERSAYYIVIGAFKFQKNAERYIAFANEKEASYELNPYRQLFYVYVFASANKGLALDELRAVRSQYLEFSDAWIFKGTLGDISDNVVIEEPTVQQDIATRSNEGDPVQEEDIAVEIIEEEVPQSLSGIPTELEKKEGFRHFYFNTYHERTGEEIDGKIKIIDPVRAKRIAERETHDIVQVPEPDNGSNTIKVSTDIFGFREVQHIIDLNNPVTDSTDAFVEMIGDSIIVDFGLHRFKKGDVIVMYNVYFYRDAAIMRSESLYELNALADMLNENSNYKVTIHGHTNGNAPGKIIRSDEESKNFFSLKGNLEEDFGTAKKLSFYRASTIKQWLMQEGIAEDRMEVKGWGGKKMIHDKNSSQAAKNVRVEIEITAD